MTAPYALFKSIHLLSRQLSPRSREVWGRKAGNLIPQLNPALLQSVRLNSEAVIDEKNEREETAREILRNFGAFLFEFLGSDPRENIRERVEDHADSLWNYIEEEQRGVVVVTAHVGNWEAAAQYAAARTGREVTIIARSTGSRRVDRLFESVRLKNGVRSWRPHCDRPGDLLRMLKEGGFAATAVEARVPDESVELDFLGRKVYFPDGIAKLARRAQVPLIPALFIRKGEGHFTVESGAPVRVEEGPEGPKRAMEQIAEVLGGYIKRCPKQWMLLEDRFAPQKNQQGGAG